jgi:hypothetical protein
MRKPRPADNSDRANLHYAQQAVMLAVVLAQNQWLGLAEVKMR